MKPEVTAFFDEQTNTVSYVLADPQGKRCAIIDSVLDFDPESGRTSTESVHAIEQFVNQQDYAVDWILETHAHADHLSAAPYLKRVFGGSTAIGAHIVDVQNIFKEVFNFEPEFVADGSQFDRLFEDGAVFSVGGLQVQVMHTPGHTPACMTYVCDNVAFVGDTLFMPDYGTARCDFPGGDAATLYQSIGKIFALPDETILYMCHDYLPEGRTEYQWQTTVADERKNNQHVHEGVVETDFVSMRHARDATLGMPRLILPSVQVNIRAGQLPPPESNGTSYLKIPLDTL